MKTTVVAIDGPAGSGKSSVSRAAAKRLGYALLDTGARYRALAVAALDRGVDLENAGAIEELLHGIRIDAVDDPEGVTIAVDGRDVTREIREPRTSAAVSAVARIPSVREFLNDGFRAIAASGEHEGMIVEGRDITTVVFPDATARILLTAAPEVRAARRGAELSGADAAGAAEQLAKRDAADSRVVDFMTAASGVVTLDSTQLNFSETVDALIEIVQEAEARNAE